MDISVRFLGSLRLLVDGVHVPVERAQTRALLALLARHPGSVVPADTLIELLWDGATPRQPVEALRTVVTRVRKALGHDHLLRTVGSSYLLDIPASSIDFHDFRLAADRAGTVQELHAALSLWHGVPFADCGRNLQLQSVAEDLEDRRRLLAERYLQLLLREGRPDAAVSFGTPLVDQRPADERVAALVTIALARIGQEREARALVARVRAAVRSVDPTAPTGPLDEAEARITTELPAPSSSTSPAGRDRDPLAGHVVELADLVGREPDLERLGAAAAAARSRGQVVLLVGDAGVGKTTLAVTFARRLGWRNWSVRCGDPAVEYLDTAPRPLGARRPGAAESAAMFAPTALGQLRQFASNAPVVVIIDDIQNASEVELLLLRSLVRTGLPRDVLVIGTLRPTGGLPAQVATVVADVTREPDVTTVELRGLSRVATRRLARRLRPGLTVPQCNRLHELTQGNAFAVRSLCELETFDVDRPVADLPAALVELTGQRIEGVPPSARPALELASLLDPPIDFGVVASLRGTDRLTLLESLRPAFENRLLVEDVGGQVRFDHELTRQAVQRRTPAALRRALHDRLALLFEERGQVVLSGHHLAGAMPDSDHPRPAPLLLQAAEAAVATQHYGIAVECFEAAERLLDPPTARRIALRRGMALEQSGRRAAAGELYDRLAADSVVGGDRDGLARAALAGLTQGVVGGDRRRVDRLRRALDHRPDDHRLELELVVQLAAEDTAAGSPPTDEVRRRAVALAEDTPADQSLLAFLDVLSVAFAPVDDEAFARIDRLATTAEAGGDPALLLRAIESRCAAAINVGDLALLRRSLDQLESELHAHPSPRQRWAAALLRTMLADLDGGGVEAAAPFARAALDLGRDLDLPDADNAYAIFRLSVAIRTGGLAALEPLIRAAATGPRATPSWHAVHAAALRDAGRADEAIEAAQRFRLGMSEGRGVFRDVGYALATAATAGLPADPELDDLRRWAVARLRGWAGRLLVVGAGAGCVGPADLYLAVADAPVPEVPETWASAWLDGSWSGLAVQLSTLAAR